MAMPVIALWTICCVVIIFSNRNLCKYAFLTFFLGQLVLCFFVFLIFSVFSVFWNLFHIVYCIIDCIIFILANNFNTKRHSFKANINYSDFKALNQRMAEYYMFCWLIVGVKLQ